MPPLIPRADITTWGLKFEAGIRYKAGVLYADGGFPLLEKYPHTRYLPLSLSPYTNLTCTPNAWFTKAGF